MLGFGAMLINLFGVNLFVSGLHSYAGVKSTAGKEGPPAIQKAIEGPFLTSRGKRGAVPCYRAKQFGWTGASARAPRMTV